MLRPVLNVRIIGLVVVYEIMVSWIGIWLNVTRYKQGTNVLQLVPGHSLHVMDLIIISAGLLPLALIIPRWYFRVEDRCDKRL